MTVEHHNPTLWQTLIESNIINFALFAAFVVWFFQSKLPAIVKQKNDDIESELKQAVDRCKVAEEQLKSAEKELSVFKANSESTKKETAKRISNLKEELLKDREATIAKLQEKHEKEIESLKASMKSNIENKIALKSVEIAENILKNQSDFSQLNNVAIQETIEHVQKNPELLKVD